MSPFIESIKEIEKGHDKTLDLTQHGSIVDLDFSEEVLFLLIPGSMTVVARDSFDCSLVYC